MHAPSEIEASSFGTLPALWNSAFSAAVAVGASSLASLTNGSTELMLTAPLRVGVALDANSLLSSAPKERPTSAWARESLLSDCNDGRQMALSVLDSLPSVPPHVSSNFLTLAASRYGETMALALGAIRAEGSGTSWHDSVFSSAKASLTTPSNSASCAANGQQLNYLAEWAEARRR